ncbi:MAG: hypothetical protein NCW75_07525 [Phycisphaera sp.]|nr:MAG: hypothetical protein NCW75_07525 [Phycisphaera sp.]
MRRALGLVLLVVFCATGCNCASKPEPSPLPVGSIDLSAYTYEEVAAAMNQRAQRLERFWAATTTTVWYIGKEGEDEVDQLEGDLHIVQPDHIALSMRKIGVDVAALGANERFYWYMDLLADDPIASIGTHAKADPDRLAGLGVPVHPLDLLLLLGFSSVPGEPMDPEQPLKLSPRGGNIVLTAPARWGVVEYTLEPDTLEPVRVVLKRDPRLPPVLTADMLRGGTLFTDRVDRELPDVSIPERVLIDVPELDARVRIRFLGAQSSKRRPDERAFDLGDSLSRYGVRLKRDLDVMHARPVERR